MQHRDDMPPNLRLAHRLLDAMEFDARFAKRFDALLRDSPLRDAGRGEAQRLFTEQLAQRLETVRPDHIRSVLATYYGERLTEVELEQLITFFESPVGKKFVAIWQSDHTPVRQAIADASRRTRGQPDKG